MAGRLAGKVAIVAGAGSRGEGVGNGKAAAILFAREGARVLSVDAVLERAAETVALIEQEGGVASAFAADVSKRAECEAMAASAVQRYGRLDVLHNNVGIVLPIQGIREVVEEDWERAMTVNVTSMMLATQAAIPYLEAAGAGSIINVSSIAAIRPWGSGTAYQTSKAAVLGLTLTLAGQLADKRIRVNAIAPGPVWTPLVAEYLSTEARDERRRAGLLQDEGTAWDVGWGAVYLASDESRWVTGQTLIIDGGITLTRRSGST